MKNTVWSVIDSNLVHDSGYLQTVVTYITCVNIQQWIIKIHVRLARARVHLWTNTTIFIHNIMLLTPEELSWDADPLASYVKVLRDGGWGLFLMEKLTNTSDLGIKTKTDIV